MACDSTFCIVRAVPHAPHPDQHPSPPSAQNVHEHQPHHACGQPPGGVGPLRPSRSSRSPTSWSRSGRPLRSPWTCVAPCWTCRPSSTRRLEKVSAWELGPGHLPSPLRPHSRALRPPGRWKPPPLSHHARTLTPAADPGCLHLLVCKSSLFVKWT